jgi:hypothetical protein
MDISIAVFILCYNEEKIIPHTIKHYNKFCKDIFILNNGSTDNTVEISKKLGCKILNFEPKGIDEKHYLDIKQNCYKPYRNSYDYIIVCDADEFLYHKNISNYIKNNKHIDIFKAIGYEMLFDNFDYMNDNYENIDFGARSPSHDKCLIFKSSVDIEYSIGCHSVYNKNVESLIQLRHLKFINIQFVIDRYKHFSQRMSQVNQDNNWAFHYKWNEKEILNYYNNLTKNKIKLEW